MFLGGLLDNIYQLILVFSFVAEYCLPLVRVGGLFIAAKGHDPHVSLGYWTIVHSTKFTNILSATNISSISYVVWQEEIRSAKAAVGKLGASMLDLCNGKLSL